MKSHYRVMLGMSVLIAALLSWSVPAMASLNLLQPDPAVPGTFVGHGGYSADGLGQNGGGGAVQAEVPAGSSVVQAYLYGSYFTSSPSLAERTINFDGTNVVLSQIGTNVGVLSSARAEVTSQVAAKVGSGGGTYNFTIGNDPVFLDGVALVVLYGNPTSPQQTIAVLDGAAASAGDTATFSFGTPLDPTAPGFSATMSLGIGFGYQGVDGPACGSGSQFSLVEVNGARLTSCAGNFDDGLGNNGALITVGGVGDSLDNPADPTQQPGDGKSPRVNDDEYYNLAPFIAQGATQVSVNTRNPSNDDIVFLAVIAVTGEGRVSTEVCDDGGDNDGDGLVDGADPDCTVTPPTNTAPTVSSDLATVTVDEGSPASNTGSWADSDGDDVTLTASLGSVTKHANGTWSWSHTPADESDSQQVTITADDGTTTATTTFQLDVVNVPPTISPLAFSGESSTACLSGNTVGLSFTVGDPGTLDSISGSVDWGDGSPSDAYVGPAFSGSHEYSAGTYSVTATAADGDGGTDTETASQAVSLLYQSSGILQPINADGNSNFKRGSTIPVKIRANDCDGVLVTDLSPRVSLQRVGSTNGQVNELLSSSAADTGDYMRWSADGLQYIYNLSTKRSQFNAGQDLTAGRYKLTITEPRMTPVVAYFDLRS